MSEPWSWAFLIRMCYRYRLWDREWQGVWDLLLQEGLSWHPLSSPLLWVIWVCSRLALVMGLGRVIPPCPVTGCCSCYSFYFYFPAHFGRESYFVLIAVPQSHGQKKTLQIPESNYHIWAPLLFSLEAAPMALMAIPPPWLRPLESTREGGDSWDHLPDGHFWAFLTLVRTITARWAQQRFCNDVPWHVCCGTASNIPAMACRGVPGSGALSWHALTALHPGGGDLQSPLKPFFTVCCCCHFILAAPLM